jgi:hypothetical protein
MLDESNLQNVKRQLIDMHRKTTGLLEFLTPLKYVQNKFSYQR